MLNIARYEAFVDTQLLAFSYKPKFFINTLCSRGLHNWHSWIDYRI